MARRARPAVPAPSGPPGAVTLDALAPGSRARVRSVADHVPTRRLAELGIRRGSEIRVLGRSAGGGVTVAIGTSRLALDRTVLRGIEVVVPA
ncbi:FeoA family protein [Jatrophihabitans fulvus]